VLEDFNKQKQHRIKLNEIATNCGSLLTTVTDNTTSNKEAVGQKGGAAVYKTDVDNTQQ
jgi:hypothetical protein